MAEIALSFVADRLAEVLNQITTYKEVHQEVDRLQTELKRMQFFLKDADEKKDDDERVRNWISDIRDVAHDAEDLIESFLIKIEIHKRRKFLQKKFFIIKEWRYRGKVKKDLRTIEIRLRDISLSRETYGITNLGHGTASEKLRKMRRSSPRGEERDIVGLDKEKDLLVAELVRKDDQWRAFSIIGMGGIGKTTLAKGVYNRGDVRRNFDCRAWVYVSQEFRTRDMLQSIIRQVTTSKENLENLQEEELEEMLHEYLLKMRYLVVLDDMWSTEAWDCLANAFPTKGNGSRLIITSRNKNVAIHVDARTCPHELQLLNKDDSWVLFCRKAFIDNADKSCPPELEETGRAMVGKCDGLPLAIIMLGGLVSRKKILNEWERVLSNIHSHFARNRNGVEAILALSYKDLSTNLKSCFLHLGHFPEDHLISTRKVVHVWVAEGLIPQQRGERMEDVAEDYLNELIDRNMVQVARMNATESVKECRLHDLLRDLSISKAKDENFLEIHGNLDSIPSSKSRRHAIYSNFNWYASLPHSTEHLRSLFFFGLDNEERIIENPDFIFRSFKLLRVIDLENTTIHILPDAVGELLHLKYLGLRGTDISTLPSTLGSLECLQTLDLAANFDLMGVPNVVWKMKNLRHLYMWVHMHIHGRQLQVDTLQQLQTLADIHVGNWMKNDPKKLISLRKLGVKGSFLLHEDEIFHSFAVIPGLQSLFLHTDDDEFPCLTEFSSLRFLTKLSMIGGIRNLPMLHEFPPNLCQLTLQHSSLTQNPMEILEKLPKLLILRLKAGSFIGSILGFSSNGFPQLKFLEFDSLEFLDEFIIEEGALPRLRRFRIRNCRKLCLLPKDITRVRNLQELEIKQMPNSFVGRVQGVDFDELQHIPITRLV